MFTPGTKKHIRKDSINPIQTLRTDSSPITPPATEISKSSLDNLIPNRPSTGTPAPWAPRLSVLARIPAVNKAGNELDPIKPVYVGEFPQVVRDEQASFLRKHVPGDACVSGGMDKETCLSWIICGAKLFVWSYLSSAAPKNCIVLELPSGIANEGASWKNRYHNGSWLLCVVNWDSTRRDKSSLVMGSTSAGIVLCNQNSRAFVYWPDIYSEEGSIPVTNMLLPDEMEVTSSPVDGKTTTSWQRQHSRPASGYKNSDFFNSMIASSVSDTRKACVALACSSNGGLWQIYCDPTGIRRMKINQDILSVSSHGSDSGQISGSKGYPRSLTWRFPLHNMEDPNRQFFLLTDNEIQCYGIAFYPDSNVSKLWSHEIVGTDSDLGIKKDLAGQKRIWPLDLQVDDRGKVITVLVATFCKDRVSSSSYMQYSLLIMQYKSRVSISSDMHERVLEKKAPIQVIIPKARLEDEDFLFSTRLRIGGKPPGSAIILSGDGTATVSHYYADSTRLYQFDLPYDAGKVLDASVLPSADDGEDGAWVLLTEKAGVWAIPEKAVVLGGVEPPERSLSRKGSSNERSTQEKTNVFAPRRASSDAWDAGNRQKAVMSGIARRVVHDEESEALLGQLFHDFLLSERVDGSFEKLQNAGAFERDGETNIFARTSRSIIDTLAKHWTTTRGSEILAMVINQLMDKQQKHAKFLQFLALSKCHEELCSKQRQSLQTILEHGEKLAGMIQLRELQNMISSNHITASGFPHSSSEAHISGALWDLIQLVGERARRNTVLLMDRDNAEVFYSKVSELEEVFYCLDKLLDHVISEDLPLEVQIQRACELSNALVSVIHAAMLYKEKHNMWYPPPEGLMPWYCQPTVRNGLWKVASLMLRLLKETRRLDISAKSDLYTHLEVLAEVLLEAYAGAIRAKLERGEEHKSLLDEYWNKRDSLLDSLYQHVKDLAKSHNEVSNVGKDEQNKEALHKFSSTLLSIAKRHEAYNTMWNLCCDLNDSVLLRNLMHESMGPRGGFSYFVFKQLHEKRQFSKLLGLGEEFQEELLIFLKDHPDLLWLHEIFLHQFSSASETLHELALSQDACSTSGAEDITESEHLDSTITLADRKRLLHLSKISAMAGKQADFEMKVKRIEADLKILKLQEEVLNLLPEDEKKLYDGRLLFRPEELIELCLKVNTPELVLHAFDVFAWTSSSFRRRHRSLLEECWRSAADQDDWGQLYQASVAEGWSDEESLRELKNTVLFRASRRCYNPGADIIEEGFDEVLPLRKDSSDVSTVKDLDYSVEAILMQHKDFPEAGKLMLTAIMLGSVRDNTLAEENPSPME